MVRAILRDGRVDPLDPLPESWSEGCALVIEPSEPANAVDDLDRWLDDLTALGDPFEERGEWERFQADLTEADRLAKECVRQQMGLP